ncbi:MAG: hypothetical protein Q8P80_05165 [Candidatus Levybacteria bacterium]|nr:hypothetical protein [Candidatus Levybacteria bacterium]
MTEKFSYNELQLPNPSERLRTEAKKHAQDLLSLYKKRRYASYLGNIEKAKEGIMVADTLFEAGLDTSEIIPEIDLGILETRNSRMGVHQADLLVQMAYFKTKTGDIEGAFSAADKVSKMKYERIRAFFAYKNIALLSDDQNIVKLALKKAVKAVKREKEPDWYTVFYMTKAAEVAYMKNLDPFKILKRSKDFADKIGEGHDVVSDSYSRCGNFKESLDLIPKIKGDNNSETKRKKEESIIIIFEEQLKRDDIEGAVKTAELLPDEYLNLFTRVNLIKAKAKKGLKNVSLDFEDIAIEVKEYDKEEKRGISQMVDFYSTLGQIASFVRQDSKPFFDHAIELILEDKDSMDADNANLAVTHLIEVGKKQAEVNIDYKDTFKMALEMADSISNRKDNFPGSEIYKVMSYEDLSNAAVKLGYFDLVDEIIKRYDSKQFTEEDMTFDKMERLSEMVIGKASLAKKL